MTNMNTSANQTIAIDDLYLIPGGETIGIEVSTRVVVVDSYSVFSDDGYVNPATVSGIRKGDIILNINGRRIENIDDVKTALRHFKDSGRTTMNIIIRRNNQVITKEIEPVTTRDGTISLGMYLKDNILGVGTLTFTYKDHFGALGHQIKDTNDTMNHRLQDQGIIKKAVVTNIIKGNRGNPGEKRAALEHDEIGVIQNNTVTGIFGILNEDISQRQPMQIKAREDVRVGEAQILTVVKGDKVETFDIQIIEVKNQPNKDIKGLKIQITDPRLLKDTGGIVQGMSGSPIIQDGKLIGAVTHVLIDNQTVGYGVFIEFMLEEIGIKVTK